MMDAVFGALITAVLGGPIFYFLGTRQRRLEKLYERRAEVIAKMCELLVEVEDMTLRFSGRGRKGSSGKHVKLPDVEYPTIEDYMVTYRELNSYYQKNSIWLDRVTCDEIDEFNHNLFMVEADYLLKLDRDGIPRSAEAREAAERLLLEIPPLRADLESRFRAILYPPPWWDYPLKVLEGIQARSRKRSGENAD